MLYVDTNILIYLLEGDGNYSKSVADTLTANQAKGGELLCSTLGITEFLSGTDSGNVKEILYSIPSLSFAPVDKEIAEKAAELQRKHTLKIGDALHLATAITKGCKEFYTNDNNLAKNAGRYLAVLGI